MNKLQIFSFFMVLSFFGYVKGMHRRFVEAVKPIATKFGTSVAQEAVTSTLKTKAPLAARGATSAQSSSGYPPKQFLDNQRQSEGSLTSTRQVSFGLTPINVQDGFKQSVPKNQGGVSSGSLFLTNPQNKVIDFSKAYDQQAQENLGPPQETEIFDVDAMGSSSIELGENSKKNVPIRAFGNMNFVSPQALAQLLTQKSTSGSAQSIDFSDAAPVVPSQSPGAVTHKSIDFNGSFSALPSQETKYSIKQKGSSKELNTLNGSSRGTSSSSGLSLPSGDQSQALQLYRSPSTPSSSQRFVLDPMLESKVSAPEQTHVPSWIEKLINSEAIGKLTEAPTQFSDIFVLQENPTVAGSTNKIGLRDINTTSSQSRSENLTQPRLDTTIGRSKSESLFLPESSALSDLQTLVLPDQSTLIVARDAHAQPVLIVGNTQGQFGLVLTATNVLEFGFIDSQGQPLIITITDPSLLLDQYDSGMQSLLKALPADIQSLLPKFVATQAVQNLLEVALLPKSQLNLGSDRTGQKMITAPGIALSEQTMQLTPNIFNGATSPALRQLPTNQKLLFDSPKVFQSPTLTLAKKNISPEKFIDFSVQTKPKVPVVRQESDLKLPEVKLPIKNRSNVIKRTYLAEGERNPLDLSEDIFAEKERESSDGVEKDLNLADNVDPVDKQPLSQSKQLVIPEKLEIKVRQIADAEFHSLPKNSSRLAKILAMLQRIQEMIINFVKSIGYSDSLRQRQVMELAKKKAAQKLAAQKMNSATWLEIIQQFMAEIWAILTSKSLKENYDPVSQNNIIE